MDLSSYFSRWRTHTPTVLQDADTEGEPWTIQYKLVSKGEAARIHNLDAEGIAEEAKQWPDIDAYLGEEWSRFPMAIQRDLLLFAGHVGTISNLTDGDKNITSVMELFALLNGVLASHVLRELNGCIVGVETEADKKNFRP